MVIVTNNSFLQGSQVPWGVLAWRSHKLRRVVGSTLAGGTMAALEAQGMLEWAKTLYAEIVNANFKLTAREREWDGDDAECACC